MKTLAAGVVLILLLGFAGFFYRNVAEQTATPQMACTLEAKICPDGSSVGRTGPSCEFAACPLPGVELQDAGLAFVIPADYAPDNAAPGADLATLASFVKPSLTGGVPHVISVSRYQIPEGETAEDVMLAHTRYQPADMQAEDFERFETVLINGKEFKGTVIERFEAQIQSAYYLARGADVLRFDVIEHDVVDWMEPALEVSKLPEHAAFLKMLGTIELR